MDIQDFVIVKSNRKNKKLKVFHNGKWIHFGDSRYEHYKDKTGIWTDLDHMDENRRKSYLKRAKGIRDKKNRRTWKNKNSPNYWSVRVLW